MAVPAPSSWLFAPGQDQNDDKKAEQEEECAETLASPAGVCRRTRHAGASTCPRNRHGRTSSTSVAATSVVVALKPCSFEPKPSSNPSFLLPDCSNAPLVCSRNGGEEEGAERLYWTGTTDDSVDAQNGDGALNPLPFNPNPKPNPNHSLPLPDFSRALLVCGRDGGEEDADRLKWTGSASDLVDVRNGDGALNPNPSSNSNPNPDPNPNPSLTPPELSKGLLVFGREEGVKVEEMGAEEGSGDLSSDEAPKQQGKRSKLDNGKAIMRSRQPEYATNHCMAERKRREKLNNQFQALKDLIRPYIRSKDDKASLLGDTIEYIKELQRRVYEKENTPCTCQGQYPTKSETIDITRLDTVQSEGLRAEKAGGYLSEPLDNKKDAAIKGDNGPTIEVRGMEDDLVMIKIVCMDRPGLFRDLMQAIHELKLQVQYANVNTNAGIVHQVIHAKVDSTKEQHANQLVADSFRCAVLKASGVTK